jgi:CheY-like chemotaxis protein
MEAVKRAVKKSGEGKTVLIVEDNAEIRRAVVKAFLSDGFTTCAEAADGDEGIAVAERIKPDIIILDLSMPVMNGLQTAPRLRKLLPRTPIILFTMYGTALLKIEAAQVGVDLVVQKTDPLSTLIKKAHELIGD